MCLSRTLFFACLFFVRDCLAASLHVVVVILVRVHVYTVA